MAVVRFRTATIHHTRPQTPDHPARSILDDAICTVEDARSTIHRAQNSADDAISTVEDAQSTLDLTFY